MRRSCILKSSTIHSVRIFYMHFISTSFKKWERAGGFLEIKINRAWHMIDIAVKLNRTSACWPLRFKEECSFLSVCTSKRDLKVTFQSTPLDVWSRTLLSWRPSSSGSVIKGSKIILHLDDQDEYSTDIHMISCVCSVARSQFWLTVFGPSRNRWPTGNGVEMGATTRRQFFSNHLWIFMVSCFSATCSLLTAAALTFEKYIAVQYAPRYYQLVTGKRMKYVMALLWLVSAILGEKHRYEQRTCVLNGLARCQEPTARGVWSPVLQTEVVIDDTFANWNRILCKKKKRNTFTDFFQILPTMKRFRGGVTPPHPHPPTTPR